MGSVSHVRFCSEHFTDYGNIVTWENTNPITGRHYLLKDRLIEWNDRPARLEIAFDVTEAEKEKQSLKFALRAEDMLVDCVRSLYEDRGIGDTLTVILDKLGRFMNADRSYVFMLRMVSCTMNTSGAPRVWNPRWIHCRACLWNSSTGGLKSLTGRNVWC